MNSTLHGLVVKTVARISLLISSDVHYIIFTVWYSYVASSYQLRHICMKVNNIHCYRDKSEQLAIQEHFIVPVTPLTSSDTAQWTVVCAPSLALLITNHPMRRPIILK